MLFVATMEVSLLAVVRAFVVRKVAFDVYLRPWREGRLPETAPVRGELDFRVDLGAREGRPMVLTADLDGDGRREFLFNLQPDRLTAFSADPGDDDFGETPLAEIVLPLPRRAEDFLVADLTGDGRETLLIHYRGKRYEPELRRTLRAVTLVDRPPPR